ncbi:MAG TPA: S9 family peptidase [Saprospiraceae bacterium]|nr:S9 family peptidase [Saprospiraceae bacterium]
MRPNHFICRVIFISTIVGVIIFKSQSISIAQVTPDHIASMKVVNGCAISDDGNYIAFTVSIPADPKKENAPNATHLYVLNESTGESKPYFTHSGVSSVQFRPGHGTLTFLSRKQGAAQNELFELSLFGGEAVSIFSAGTAILSYAWSPDGKKLAYGTRESLPAPKTSLSYKPNFYEENMNQRLAWVKDFSIPDQKARQIDVTGSVYMMQWSPDGTKIAFSAAPTSTVDDSYMRQQVMVADVSTGKVIAKIENEGKLGQIEWSPDNERLALLAANDIHDPIEGRILIVSAQGGKPAIINPDFQGKYERIQWSSAQNIHYLASESTATSMGTIRPDGSSRQVIFKSDRHNITHFSRSQNGNISFVASSPEHPNELFTLKSGSNSSPMKRTDHNPWLAGLKLGKQEVVRYPARDGQFDIEGMLIYPVDYRQGNAVPVITVVHGGPEAHYSNGWLTGYSTPGQMAAARGYAVFYPNYRGSTGRGIAFIYSSQGDLGGKEFDDVVDGVDYLINAGIADRNRIGVTGGSYGGYASAWMSTYYSDRFAAAVMFVGISNNISKWGTSDIPEELFLVHSRKRIWDNWLWQLERSPIYYVDRAQTPILIMHGADDPRVHPAQSMELYRHLKVRKPEVPVRLIYYPGEGHGNSRSGSKYDYNLRMLQWFDTYLMSGNAHADKPNLDLPE